jgi:hypothetical protein
VHAHCKSDLILLLGAKDSRLWTEFHIEFEKVAKAKGYSEYVVSRSKGRLRSIRLIQSRPYVAQTLQRFITAGEGLHTEKLRLCLEADKARRAAFRFIQRAPKLKELTIVSHYSYGIDWSFLLWLLWLPRLEMLRFEMPLSITATLRPHPESEGEQSLNSILGYVLRLGLPRG